MKRIIQFCILLFASCIIFTACADRCDHIYDNGCDHIYDNECDAICNECEETREVSKHSYTVQGYDDYYHYQKCARCGVPNDASKAKHVLDDKYACECGVKFIAEKTRIDAARTSVKLYNANNKVIKDLIYINGELLTFVDVFYAENGNKIKDEQYSGDGDLQYFNTYEYGEDNKLLKKEGFEANGKRDLYHLYEYDEKGNLSKDKNYYDDGTIDEINTYVF